MSDLWKWIKGKRNLLVLSGLLLIFVAGLYSINFLFEQDSEPRLVVLKEKRNSGTLIASPNTSFRIESATKQRNSYPMYDFFVADSNTVLLNRMHSSYTGIKLSVLRMDDNEVKDVSKNTGYGVAFTPDRNHAIFTRYGLGDNENHTYAYDWNSGELKQIGQDDVYTRFFIDNNTYVGFNGVNFKKVDITSDKKENIFSLEKLQSRIAKLSKVNVKRGVFPFAESVVVDAAQSNMYMIAQLDEENDGLYRLSLQDDKDDELLVSMSRIDQYIKLNDGDILISGMRDNTLGLYLYERQHKQFTLLKKGDILSFDLDQETSRLAYVEMLDDQMSKNELHAVYLKDGAFHSDTIIYRNIKDFIKVTWLGDDLFVGGSSLDSSEIYRFTFSVW